MGPLLILLAPLAIVLWWCFVVWLIAQLSGWARLARRYRALNDPSGQRHSFQSLGLGLANYGNCVTVVLADEGLCLRVFFLFRPGHPTLLIPWGELFDPQEKKFLFFKHMRMTIGDPEAAKLSLNMELYGKIRTFMEQRISNRSTTSVPAESRI